MVKNYEILLEDYFKNYSLIDSNIASFNNFVEKGLKKDLFAVLELG